MCAILALRRHAAQGESLHWARCRRLARGTGRCCGRDCSVGAEVGGTRPRALLVDMHFLDVANGAVLYPLDDAAHVLGGVALEAGLRGLMGIFFSPPSSWRALHRYCGRAAFRSRRACRASWRRSRRPRAYGRRWRRPHRVDLLVHLVQIDAPVIVTLRVRVFLDGGRGHVRSLARWPSSAGVRQSTIAEGDDVLARQHADVAFHPVIPMPMKAMLSLSLGGNAPARPRALEERIVKAPALAPPASTSRLDNCLSLNIGLSLLASNCSSQISVSLDHRIQRSQGRPIPSASSVPILDHSEIVNPRRSSMPALCCAQTRLQNPAVTCVTDGRRGKLRRKLNFAGELITRRQNFQMKGLTNVRRLIYFARVYGATFVSMRNSSAGSFFRWEAENEESVWSCGQADCHSTEQRLRPACMFDGCAAYLTGNKRNQNESSNLGLDHSTRLRRMPCGTWPNRLAQL